MTTRTLRTDRAEPSGRALKHQPNRFAGLFVAPFAGLGTAWLIHVWTQGVNLHWGPLSWVVHASEAAPYVAVALITAATIGLSVLGWHFTSHRETPKRASLSGSIGALGTLFAINVGTGPHYWWSGLFLLAGWTVAITWSLVRLDVARNDKHADDSHDDGFLEKIGLKGWRARKVEREHDVAGNVVSTKVHMAHAQGDVVDQLQDAVPNIESAVGAPAGLSRAVPTDRADRSTLTVMHVDPLKDVLTLPDASAPGGSIADPLLVGTYSDGTPVLVYLAGGKLAVAPTSYLFMGMTRTGKTTCENEMLAEVGTRRGVVILYLNRAKGMQDVRPIIPVVEAAVIADDSDSGGLYREAMRQVKRIMAYRNRTLAQFGISAWSAEKCFDSPPWRTDENGRRVQMEPMPMLICHFGEADDILASDNGTSVYLASKGLSLGTVTGWSLQRADYKSMPTGLRFNLGTAFCFGCGDSDSAEFALSKSTILAGARPDAWRQGKPGYFYFEGLGIDDAQFPVPARAFGQGIGDEDISEAILRRCLEYGPRMSKLDSGSVSATDYEEDGKSGNWWREVSAETDRMRAELTATRTRKPANPQPATTPQDDDDEDEAEAREVRAEMEEEVRVTTHVEGVELYPEDGARPEHATADLPTVPPDEGMSWEDDRPAPRDRKAAIEALIQALEELAKDPNLADPDDPSGRTVILTAALISERYTFRSRPFFVEVLIDMANGDLPGPAGLVLTPAPDLGAGKGKYRLQRVVVDH